MNVTTAIYLDTRRQKQDKTYPVKLRITFQRKRKYYDIGRFSLSANEFEKVMGPKPRGDLKELRMKFNLIEQKALNTIDDLPEFSFEKFEKRFFNKQGAWQELFFAFQQHIDELKRKGQVSTASTYLTAMNSFSKFSKKNEIKFDEVTASFLYDYESYMYKERKSPTTISMNTRCLRRLYNLAINRGDARKDLYPFGSKEAGLYEPPESNNFKKAISKPEIKKIFEYEPKNSTEHFNRDIWLFSYLGNGMNMADIFRLKYGNIHNDEIVFIRKKTSTKRKTKPIIVPINTELDNIINRWGNKHKLESEYIFPVLNNHLNAIQEMNKIKQATKQCNKYIQRIANALNISSKVTTYTARHSFASILKHLGESTEYISEQLGHSNIKVTENYLNSFDSEKRKVAQKKLINW